MASTEKSTGDDANGAPSSGLSERDQRILDFEREWVHNPRPKDEAVREQFDLSTTRYYQVLNAVIDSPAAIVYDPMLVRRLQRLRASKASARTLLQPDTTGFSRFS